MEKIDRLVVETKPKSYDEAMDLLRDLRDLAGEGGRDQIAAKIRRLRAALPNKPEFQQRLDKFRSCGRTVLDRVLIASVAQSGAV